MPENATCETSPSQPRPSTDRLGALTDSFLAQVVEKAEQSFDQKDWRAARDVLEVGVRLAPDRPDIRTAIGSMSFLLGDFEAASDSFAAAVAQNPENPDYLIQLAVCQLKLGRAEDAAANLRHALVWRPNDSKTLGFLGNAYCDLGRHREAVTIFERAAELGADETAEFLLGLARSLKAVGEVERARRALTRLQTMEPGNDRAASLLRELETTPFADTPSVAKSAIDAWGREIVAESGLSLTVGRSSYVHGNVVRNPSGAKTAVTIGNFTSIATGLSIVGYDHHSEWITMFPFLDDGTRDLWPGTQGIAYPQAREFGSNKNRGDVVIGNDVWIGVDVKIFKGVTIGDGAVIGAGSLVNKSVPPYTIVAGVPARPIRRRFSDEDIATLQEVRWWDWPDAAINRNMRVLCSGDFEALRRVQQEGLLSPRAGGGLAMDDNVPDPNAAAVKYLAELPQSPAWVQGQISQEDATLLFDLVDAGTCNAVLEIGVASGWSSAVLLHLLRRKPPSKGGEVWLHSYDIGERCYFDANRPVGAAVHEVVPDLEHRWRLHVGDARTACRDLRDQQVDLAFIDANHMHPWATFDLLALLPILAPNAWVALHDISLPVFTTNPEWRVFGPKYLYDRWPWEKRSVKGKRDNIGAICVPADHEKVREFCRTVLDLPWETSVPPEVREELLKENESASKHLAAFPTAPKWVTGMISGEDASLLSELVDAGVTQPVVEVGVASGWSSAILLHLLKRKPPTCGADTWLYSYDIGQRCYFDPARRVGEAVDEVVPELARHWKLQVGDARAAGRQLKGRGIDLAFIDANHEHPWPTFDLLALLPALAPDAWVALHDISLPLFASKPEWRVYGPKHLYDHWPWKKRSVRGQLNNIGAIQVPGDHVKVREFCKTVLALPWESGVPEDLQRELLQARG